MGICNLTNGYEVFEGYLVVLQLSVLADKEGHIQGCGIHGTTEYSCIAADSRI